MAADPLGPWDPLGLDDAVELFGSYPRRWWIAGGRALELSEGRSWRAHGDLDVGVIRDDLPELHSLLSDWDVHVAAAGELTKWTGEPLVEARHENNLWCRRGPDEAWELDVLIGEGTEAEWIYRRDRSVRLPWRDAVLHAPDGHPYLAPEVQMLFKSGSVRPKDDVDASEVLPLLGDRPRSWLADVLPPPHPWQALLEH